MSSTVEEKAALSNSRKNKTLAGVILSTLFEKEFGEKVLTVEELIGLVADNSTSLNSKRSVSKVKKVLDSIENKKELKRKATAINNFKTKREEHANKGEYYRVSTGRFSKPSSYKRKGVFVTEDWYVYSKVIIEKGGEVPEIVLEHMNNCGETPLAADSEVEYTFKDVKIAEACAACEKGKYIKYPSVRKVQKPADGYTIDFDHNICWGPDDEESYKRFIENYGSYINEEGE